MTLQQMQTVHSSHCPLAGCVGRWPLSRRRKRTNALYCGTSSSNPGGGSRCPGPKNRRCTTGFASVYGRKRRLLAGFLRHLRTKGGGVLYSLCLLTGDRDDLRSCPSSAKRAVDPVRLVREPVEWFDGTSVTEIIHLNHRDRECLQSHMSLRIDV